MIDELERRLDSAARLGDAEARARLLVARMRAGKVCVNRFKLAASLGDVDAFLLLDELGEPAPDLLDLGGDLSELSWSDEVRSRIVVAAVRAALPLYDFVREDRSPRQSLAATVAWIQCPCEEHVALAQEAAVALRVSLSTLTELIAGSADLQRGHDLFAAQCVARACHEAALLPSSPNLHTHDALLQTLYALSAPSQAKPPRQEDAREWLRRAVAAEVVPWALGDADPLADLDVFESSD